MTKVIQLWGGPGVGKSTMAAEVYAHLKRQQYNVELTREYVKSWAWKGQKIGRHDQVYIMGKQIHAESILYGKVDWIVTDSPIMLSGFYEQYYQNINLCGDFCKDFIKITNVDRYDFLINRTKPYSQAGRYETEADALKIDSAIESYMQKYNILPIKVNSYIEVINESNKISKKTRS